MTFSHCMEVLGLCHKLGVYVRYFLDSNGNWYVKVYIGDD